MEGINENTPLGKRLIELAKESGVSDFYITPWEPLAYRKNGDLVFDSYIYQLDEDLKVVPGCADYAMVIGNYRFRVNRRSVEGGIDGFCDYCLRQYQVVRTFRCLLPQLSHFCRLKMGYF